VAAHHLPAAHGARLARPQGCDFREHAPAAMISISTDSAMWPVAATALAFLFVGVVLVLF
jgi:hypothetical protein